MADNSLDSLFGGVQDSQIPHQQLQTQNGGLDAIMSDVSVNNKAPSIPGPQITPDNWKPRTLGPIGNAVYGAGLGFANLVQGPAQFALRGIQKLDEILPGYDPNDKLTQALSSLSHKFDNSLKEQEANYQQDTPGSVAAGIGRAAASVLPFILNPAGAPSSLASALGTGAAAGALTQPVTNGGDDFWAQKTAQAGLGAIGGGLGYGIGKAIGGALNPTVSPEVQAALDKNIQLTPLQMFGQNGASLEKSIGQVPLMRGIVDNAQQNTLNSFNKEVYNRVLRPIGLNADDIPVGANGVSMVRNAASNQYTKILENANFPKDVDFISSVQAIKKTLNNGEIDKALANKFNKIIENRILNKFGDKGYMTGPQYQEVEQTVYQLAKKYGGSNDPGDSVIADALNSTIKSMKSSLEKNNPMLAKDLQAANEAWANYAVLRKAAGSMGADKGVFTPSQLATAVRANDKSVDHGAYAEGRALMQDLSNAGQDIIKVVPDNAGVSHGTLNDLTGLGVGALGYLPTKAMYSGAANKIAKALLTGDRGPVLNGIGNGAQLIAPALMGGALSRYGTGQ
jgi:hypothetical protein